MPRGIRKQLLERAEERDLDRQVDFRRRLARGRIEGQPDGRLRPALVVDHGALDHFARAHGCQLWQPQSGRNRAHVLERIAERGLDLLAILRHPGGLRSRPRRRIAAPPQRIEAHQRERDHLTGSVVEVGADPPKGALAQGRGALGGLPHPFVECLVLVDQRGQLLDLRFEGRALARDGLGALAHDAVEEQVRERDTDCDQRPGAQSGVPDFLVDLLRRLVELGDGDDAVGAALANRHVHLQQVVELLALQTFSSSSSGLISAATWPDSAVHQAAFDRELTADELAVGAVEDDSRWRPDLERDDSLAQ